MTVDEATQRLADLALEIERHHTAIWLAEREREEVRTEMRRLLNSIPPGPCAAADQSKQGATQVPGSFP